MKYVIGIDGGGTKTEFVLADAQGNILKQIIKEGSNPNDIGIERCVDILQVGLEEIAGEYDKNDLHIFAGIAGAGVGSNANAIREGLAEYPQTQVDSDLANALEVCLSGEDGLVVICGTGISCCIRENGQLRFVGGYGYLFEEGGSGYAYGRDAIIAALKCEDGVGEKTVLLEYLQGYFGKSIRASLGELLRKGKSFVASFCPLVWKGYDEGDKVCEKIVEDNLRHTVALIKSALGVMGKKTGKITFIGGVGKAPLFQQRMRQELCGGDLEFCQEKPVLGAVKRAMKTLLG